MTQKPELLVDLVTDIVCPWCYVGLRSMLNVQDNLARNFDVSLRCRPYQLGPDTPVEGVDRQAYYESRFPDADVRAQGRARLIEAAQRAGFDFDPSIPERLPNTLDAHRAARIAASEGAAAPYVRALYDSYWLHGADIGQATTLADIAEMAGLDRRGFLARLECGEKRDETRADAQALRAAGVTGVPTFIINERRGFSGALPPADLEAAIRRAANHAEEMH
ncbi:MAG: DsbA family oxidoreductase [Parvularculaceae bacterium]